MPYSRTAVATSALRSSRIGSPCSNTGGKHTELSARERPCVMTFSCRPLYSGYGYLLGHYQSRCRRLRGRLFRLSHQASLLFLHRLLYVHTSPGGTVDPSIYILCRHANPTMSISRVPSSSLTQLALDEVESLLSVLVDVLLVSVGVVARAAVRISRVTVALDEGRAAGRAMEAAGAGGELICLVSPDSSSGRKEEPNSPRGSCKFPRCTGGRRCCAGRP